MSCPLCLSPGISLFCEVKNKKYYNCHHCSYLFLDRAAILDEIEEKKVYDNHENDPDDTGYRKFLSRLLNPLLEQLKPYSSGLDFGCGPGPTLSMMLQERGFSMSVFDKIYHSNDKVLEEKFDFIVMTEVIEHLDRPQKTLTKLIQQINDGGFFGVMTKFYQESIDFQNWYYMTDPTHIGFFSIKVFEWMESEFHLKRIFCDNDNVIIWQKL